MSFNASLFFTALGLACVLEALPWVLAPEKAREALRLLLQQKPEHLRLGGLALLAAGVIVAALSR